MPTKVPITSETGSDSSTCQLSVTNVIAVQVLRNDHVTDIMSRHIMQGTIKNPPCIMGVWGMGRVGYVVEKIITNTFYHCINICVLFKLEIKRDQDGIIYVLF